jgi:hypothetical protein
MMRASIFLLSLCVCLGSVCAQTESDYELTVVFEPSFSNKSEFTIRRAEKGCTIQLKVWNKGKRSFMINETAKLNKSEVDNLQNLLRSYEFKIKTNQDTIGTEKIFENGDSVTAYVISEGLDGVNVKGTYTTNSVSKHFAFWSPEKNSDNYKIVKNILSLGRPFRRKRTCEYLKTLEGYF